MIWEIKKNKGNNTYNILLFGESGTGISYVGNLILGENAFETGSNLESVTKFSSIKARKEDPEISVIDTIGISFDSQDFSNPLTDSIKLVDKINFIILILNSNDSRIRNDKFEAINLLSNFFPNNLSDHFGIIFNLLDPKYSSRMKKYYEEIKIRINEFTKFEINKQYILY